MNVSASSNGVYQDNGATVQLCSFRNEVWCDALCFSQSVFIYSCHCSLGKHPCVSLSFHKASLYVCISRSFLKASLCVSLSLFINLMLCNLPDSDAVCDVSILHCVGEKGRMMDYFSGLPFCTKCIL